MRWSIVLLVALGLFAAISASVLVGALRAIPSSAGAGVLPSKVEVILAAKPLTAMSAVSPNDITLKVIAKENLPEGYFSDPVQVIGRILAVSVAKEQMLTQTCFVKEGDRARLAAAIPHGMRAITMTLPNSSTSGGLLYPGCVVDVLASFMLPSKSRTKGKAISTTLLQGIQVIAVENSSIMTKEGDKEDKEAKEDADYSGNKKLTLTMMVSSRQAESLQLAREYGTISIVMRNPLDKSPVMSDSTVLNEGKLAKFGSALAPTGFDGETDLLKEISRQAKSPAKSDLSDDFNNQPEQPLEQWNVVVIRGQDVQVQKIDLPETEDVPLDDIE